MIWIAGAFCILHRITWFGVDCVYRRARIPTAERLLLLFLMSAMGVRRLTAQLHGPPLDFGDWLDKEIMPYSISVALCGFLWLHGRTVESLLRAADRAREE